MALVTDAGEDIDSRCQGCAQEPGAESSEAVGWIVTPKGYRSYYCQQHLAQLARFGTGPEDMDDHPLTRPCQACRRLTLIEDIGQHHRCPDCQAA